VTLFTERTPEDLRWGASLAAVASMERIEAVVTQERIEGCQELTFSPKRCTTNREDPAAIHVRMERVDTQKPRSTMIQVGLRYGGFISAGRSPALAADLQLRPESPSHVSHGRSRGHAGLQE
jgi:hypothetical protein